MSRIIDYSVHIDNVHVSVLAYPKIQLSGTYNSVDLSLPMEYSWVAERIDEDMYVECLVKIDGNEYFFIVDSAKIEEKFGEETLSLQGLSRVALIEERFLPLLGELEFSTANELLGQIREIMGLFDLYLTGNFVFFISNEDFPTSEKSILSVLKDLAQIVNMQLVSSADGKGLKFIAQPYTEADIQVFPFTLDRFTDITQLSTNYSSETRYNIIDIIGAGEEESGGLILETEEKTPGTYSLYVYSEPNIDTFSSVEVESTDGTIITISQGEVVDEEETVDFKDNKSSLKYPMLNLTDVTWYSDTNTVQTTVGSREVSVLNSDDMALCSVKYKTIRNVYELQHLTEPVVKIKVTAIK